MFGNGHGSGQPVTMTPPSYNKFGSQSSASGRSRTNSDAMDIHVITDRDLDAREHNPGYSNWTNNGSPSIYTK